MITKYYRSLFKGENLALLLATQITARFICYQYFVFIRSHIGKESKIGGGNTSGKRECMRNKNKTKIMKRKRKKEKIITPEQHSGGVFMLSRVVAREQVSVPH